MLRVHGFDIRAQSSPELGKSLQRHRVGAGRWRDDAPAAFEQARKSRLRPTIFRARYRMRWNDGAAWQRFLYSGQYPGIAGAGVRSEELRVGEELGDTRRTRLET